MMRGFATSCVFSFLCLSNVPSLFAAPFVPERNAQCVAYSQDGRLVATGKSGLSNAEFPPRPHPTPSKCGEVQVWDAETGQLLQRMETFGDLTKVGFSPDGKTIAAARLFATADQLRLDAVLLWDVATGRLLHEFNRCHAFDFSPDGTRIVVLSRTRCVLFDAASRERLGELEPLGGAISVEYAPDGKQVAGICRHDGQYLIRGCDLKTGQTVGATPSFEDVFYSFCFSPDGKLLASGHAGGNVLVWDAETWTAIARLQTGGAGRAHPFFAPDGALLAAGDQENGDVVVWALGSQKEVRRFTFERGAFHIFSRRDDSERERPEVDPSRFVFSPDGSAILAGCYGGIERLVSSGQEVRRFHN